MESFDLQKAYLKLILGFIGFSDIQTVAVEQTLSPPKVKDKLLGMMTNIRMSLMVVSTGTVFGAE